jgi:Na+/proline symporter
MMAGLFAAGLGSLNSAINAMSSALIADIYRVKRPGRSDAHYLFAGRVGVVMWGVVLGAFAVLCVFWQRAASAGSGGQTLIDLALSVMNFAYAGLVGVFLTAILTRRGSGRSAICALVAGFVVVFLMQRWVWIRWTPHVPLIGEWLRDLKLAFPWHLTLATGISLCICLSASGKRDVESSPEK